MIYFGPFGRKLLLMGQVFWIELALILGMNVVVVANTVFGINGKDTN